MMMERWTKFSLGKGFGFYPVDNGRLSGSDLIGHVLLKEYSKFVICIVIQIL